MADNKLLDMHGLKFPFVMNGALLQLHTATLWYSTGTKVYEKTVSEKNVATQNESHILPTHFFFPGNLKVFYTKSERMSDNCYAKSVFPNLIPPFSLNSLSLLHHVRTY